MSDMTTALNDEKSKAIVDSETIVDAKAKTEEIANEVQNVVTETENVEQNEATEVRPVPDYSSMGLKEIIQSFQEMLERGDQQELYKYAEIIKAAFYKVLKKEKIASGMFNEKSEEIVTTDGNAVAEDEQQVVSNNPFAEIERGFKELYSNYKTTRANFMQDLEKVKEENLAKKLEIIEELKSLLDKAEDVNHTFPAFRELQNRWKSISMVPQAKAKDLWETYQHCVEKFYDYIKINNEFRDLDFKKNLEAKTALCERAEALENETNVVTAFKELQKLHEEWKELGPVAKEYREQIWDRFKTITSKINKKHQNFFETLKEDQKNNLEAKSSICAEAEAIAEKEVSQSNEWNSLSKQMEELQEKWKTIGFASKKTIKRFMIDSELHVINSIMLRESIMLILKT
jgi:Domain of Unknown Function (DUF349).